MMLSGFALLAGASPKWVLNTQAVIGRLRAYTVAAAERLAVVRVLNSDLAVALPRAWQIADDALRGTGAYRFSSPDGTIALEVDVDRIRAAVAIRRSQLATMYSPRRAGRPARKPRNPVRAAEQHGLDLTLLRANLARSPAERLRQLDAMVSFRTRVQRKESR